jgi:hypothetical protein
MSPAADLLADASSKAGQLQTGVFQLSRSCGRATSGLCGRLFGLAALEDLAAVLGLGEGRGWPFQPSRNALPDPRQPGDADRLI